MTPEAELTWLRRVYEVALTVADWAFVTQGSDPALMRGHLQELINVLAEHNEYRGREGRLVEQKAP